METEIRRRRGQEVRDDEREDAVGERRGRGEEIDRSFTFLMLLLLALLASCISLIVFSPSSQISIALLSFLDTVLASLGVLARQHAVVLDAGSTGSRVLASLSTAIFSLATLSLSRSCGKR